MTAALPWTRAQLDALIVDLDGTMVDTLGDFVQALQRMLADLPAPFCNFTVTPQLVEKLVGKGSENLIKNLLERMDTAQGTINSVAIYPQAWASYQRHYPLVNGRYSAVYPGVQAALQHWQAQGLRLACVTNKPTAFAHALLADKGLTNFFTLVLGGDAVLRKKPDPMPLLHACAQLRSSPARTLMVGDSSNDALAARAAGCPVLLVRYGYNHGQPVDDVDADARVDSLAALQFT